MLAGCAASTPSASAGLRLPALPAGVARCERPLALPDRALSRAEVEQLWARDRAALSRCGLSLAAVLAFYEDLGQRLAGTGK